MTRSLSKLASYISKMLILDRKPPSAKAAFEPRMPELCLRFRLPGMRIRGVPELQSYASKSCGFATNKWPYVSYYNTSTQYCLVCFDCQMGLANRQCWICHKDMPKIPWCTWTSITWVQKVPLGHKYVSRVSYSDISTWMLPRLFDCIMWLADMQCSIWHNESYDICWRDSSAPESGGILLFHSKYVCGFMLPVHLKFSTDDWLKPFAASFSQFNSCHLSCNRCTGGTSYVTYQFTSSEMVINNKHEHQWNPTLAISNPRYNNSNIIDWREKDSSLQ